MASCVRVERPFRDLRREADQGARGREIDGVLVWRLEKAIQEALPIRKKHRHRIAQKNVIFGWVWFLPKSFVSQMKAAWSSKRPGQRGMTLISLNQTISAKTKPSDAPMDQRPVMRVESEWIRASANHI